VVPNLHEPLLSVAALCDEGFSVCFDASECRIFQSSDLSVRGTVVGNGYRKGNLFYLPSLADVRFPTLFSSIDSVSSSIAIPHDSCIDTTLMGYHNLLSRIGLRPLKAYLRVNNIKPSAMDKIQVQKCPICIQSKMHRVNFKTRSPYRSQTPGLIIHSDVCSFEEKSREGYSYFVTFVNDCLKAVIVYPMKSKSNTFQCFKLF
jgi:hypothetical protein